MNHRVSIVICTYNRCALLEICLRTLLDQMIKEELQSLAEILVINNNCTDDTVGMVNDLHSTYSSVDLKVISELNTGLSFARNRGFADASFDWIVYLDDDAKVGDDFLLEINFLLQNHSNKIIGGVYYPWYHFGRPKWFKDKYASNKMVYQDFQLLPNKEYISGGIMFWPKNVLENLGGFDTRVGMKGSVMAYGEETFLQDLARSKGHDVYYDPNLIIYHVVAEQKLNCKWFLKSARAKGRDIVLSGTVKSNVGNGLFHLLLGAAVMAKDFVMKTPLLLFKNDYYKENWVIEVFSKMSKRLGLVSTMLSKNRK